MAASSQGLEVGEVLAGRYELIEEIGRGGFGVVFRATQLGMNRDVAVKLLHASGPPGQEAQMRDRFKREAMMARNLNHPHTIRQYDFGETADGMMYLVLEYLNGQNLVEVIRKEGALGDARVRRMAEGVLKSLAEAHAQGIVHRDLKPANIMLCNVYGERDYVKVLDFGIAKTVMGDTDLTAAGVAMGSPRYMAPELLRGDNPSPASDVYAVAITFAEAIMGKPLLRAENSVEAAQMQLSPKPLPVPPELEKSSLWQWLSIALKKPEADRFQDAEEMLRFLDATPAELVARGADAGAGAAGKRPKLPPPPSSSSTLAEATEENEMEEEDDAAPTIRVDAADVDAYLASRAAAAAQGPAVLDPAETLDETVPKVSVPSSFGAANGTTDRPRPQAGVDESRRTVPLPAHPSSPDPAQGPAFPVGGGGTGGTPAGDDEGPTQLVSREDALAAVSAKPADPLQHVFQGGFGNAAPVDGEQRTQMIPLDEPQQPSGFRTQGAHRAGMGTDPQISGQAFSGSAVDGGASTQFVEAVSGDRSGVSAAKRKKYLLLLFALILLGIAGAAAIGFVIFQLGQGRGDQPIPQPKIVAPIETEPATKMVEFKVFSTPHGAALLIDGAEKGQTPAKFKLAEASLPLTVELVLAGHERRSITLEQGGQTTFDLKLEELPKPEEVEPAEEEKVEEEVEEKPERKPVNKPKPKPKPKPRPKPEEKKPVIDIWD